MDISLLSEQSLGVQLILDRRLASCRSKTKVTLLGHPLDNLLSPRRVTDRLLPSHIRPDQVGADILLVFEDFWPSKSPLQLRARKRYQLCTSLTGFGTLSTYNDDRREGEAGADFLQRGGNRLPTLGHSLFSIVFLALLLLDLVVPDPDLQLR